MFHSKITWPFPQKSHECALKLTDLWITSLLFDLNYKFINGSFAFSPGNFTNFKTLFPVAWTHFPELVHVKSLKNRERVYYQ